MKKIGVFLMTKKGFLVLKSLLNHDYTLNLAFVVGALDTNIHKDYNTEIRKLCSEYGIAYYDRDESGYKDLKVEYLLAISWRWLIKTENTPPLIVLHDSLLPRYRGFAPLVNSLINGERKIGVTALFASNDYDRGPIIGQTQTDIQYPIKIEKAIDLIAECYVYLVLDIFHKIKSNSDIYATPQNESKATYSLWRTEEDYKIDWHQSSKKIKRFIDAVGYPYLGAFAFVGKRKVRIFEVSQISDITIENRSPGKVIFMEQGNPVVVCGKGLLKIELASFDDNNEPLLPLKLFRTKFY